MAAGDYASLLLARAQKTRNRGNDFNDLQASLYYCPAHAKQGHSDKGQALAGKGFG